MVILGSYPAAALGIPKPMTTDLETVLGWRGRTVHDRDGERIGKLGALYLDAVDDQPAYAGVHTGLFGRHETVLPLSAITDTGGELRVPYDADAVKGAPRLDPGATLTDEEEDAVREHYRQLPQAETDAVPLETDPPPAGTIEHEDARPADR